MMRSAVATATSSSTTTLSLMGALMGLASGQKRGITWFNPGRGKGTGHNAVPNYESARAKRRAELNKQLKAEADEEAELRALDDERLAKRKVRAQEPYFARGAFAPLNPKPLDKDPDAPDGNSDTINRPEFQAAFGRFETMPPTTHGGGAAAIALSGEKFERDPPDNQTHMSRITGLSPVADGHHPFYDYTSDSGVREAYSTKNAMSHIHWDEKVSMHALYKAAIRGCPLIKHYYYMLMPLDSMHRRIRERFEANRHVKDREAIRMLIHLGWQDYTEIITFRRTKASVHKHFMDDESQFDLMKHYSNEEGKAIEERRLHMGGKQSKDGDYDGFWNRSTQMAAEEYEKLEGRIPVSYTASKGYFEVWKPDGTHFWERNMDYEGWYIKNVDPDRKAARKEITAWLEAGYNQPKHYAAKNRRGYRRFVRDVDAIVNMTSHESYAATRENMFHMWIRDTHPESNRLYAEKKLARMDDQVFTTKFDEMDTMIHQAMREFPNPRLWKTDAFYLRVRELTAHMEYNWAKAPVGMELERAWNEWISADINYAIYTSTAFAEIKADKARNPMAKTWADFYADFDPDEPATRVLPWYHKDFDYDRRYFWDERCMRMKKWVQSGDIDSKNDFFQKEVAEWEQMVNRPELFRKFEAVEYKYTAPRMVQLYRALGKRNDMALVNQMKDYLLRATPALNTPAITEAHGDAKASAAVTAALEKGGAGLFEQFVFDVPVVIYPDGYVQPQLGADGRPIEATA